MISVFISVAAWMRLQKSEFAEFSLQCTFVLMVASTLLRPQSALGWILELAPVRFLGRISYSIYIWQMLFFPFWAHVQPSHSKLLEAIQTSGWRYVALVAASLISYFLIEKPMVKIGHRLDTSADATYDSGTRNVQSTRYSKEQALTAGSNRG
jgi:peptidoglycan/LPS O-acetylase OafA/YrhL